MPAEVDDGSIANDAGLLRRIHPDQVTRDKNTNLERPSSAAFKDPRLSVDAESILHANRRDWHFLLAGYPGFSLVRFSAGAARALDLPVVHKPLVDNPAHAEVLGKKTGRIADSLRRASDWVHLERRR